MILNNKIFHKKGMTLIEILIAVSLVAVISVVIYQSIAGGIMVWRRNQRLLVEEDIVIFFDKLTYDLKNSFEFSVLNISGGETSFSFPTIVYMLNDSDDQEYEKQIGMVEYFLNYDDHSLRRRQAGYGQSIDGSWGREQILIENIEDIKFKYAYLSEGKDMESSRISGILPYGISVYVRFSDDFGERVIEKFISIPIRML